MTNTYTEEIGGFLVTKRKPRINKEDLMIEPKTETIQNEQVNHPNHYNFAKYEVIDVIEDWGLDFCEGNALKYLARYKHKQTTKEKQIEDLDKAIWYLERKKKQIKEQA